MVFNHRHLFLSMGGPSSLLLLGRKSSPLIETSACVFNATFNNIAVISWRSAVFVEETGVSGENH